MTLYRAIFFYDPVKKMLVNNIAGVECEFTSSTLTWAYWQTVDGKASDPSGFKYHYVTVEWEGDP